MSLNLISNALAQQNYEDELVEFMNRTNRGMLPLHYFQPAIKLSTFKAKLLFERTIEQSQQ